MDLIITRGSTYKDIPNHKCFLINNFKFFYYEKSIYINRTLSDDSVVFMCL